MTRPTRSLALALTLLLLATSLPAAAQEAIRTADYDVQALEFPPLRDFEVPSPERITLDNGMTIFLLEDHELPQIQASARISGGSVYEPAEKVGLASITGTVMRTGGTASMSSDSLNLVLEGLGATVETGIGTTAGSAFMSTLTEHIDTVLPIFAEVLREPAFAQEKVDLAKNQQKSAISRRNDNAQQIAFREFDKVVYGADSPYARHPEYYTIDAITREDVVAFHEQYVRPENIILSVWGDFDAGQMEDRLRAVFGDWTPPGEVESPTPPTPDAERAHSVSFVQKGDVTQSTILMGHPGELQRNDPDYTSVVVMNEVLSGGFSGRLFQNVRKEKGLAYSVFGSYSAGYDRPGRFRAGVFTKSETTVQAAQAVIEEVERMRQEPPTDDELQLAKDSYLNSFVFNFDTKSEILGRLMTYAHYDYPADFLQQTQEGVEQVTAEDVLRVSKKYLYPGTSHILIVGRRQDFSDSLATLASEGTVNTIDVSIPTSPPGEETPAATAEERAAGLEKLIAAREALGGSAFDEIQNVQVASVDTVQSPQGTAAIQSTLALTMGGKLHAEQQLPNGATITVTDDGESMTLQTPAGTQQAPPQRRQQIKGQLWRNMIYLLAKLDETDIEVQDRGQQQVEGTTYEAVRVSPPAGSPFTLYLDPASMRPMRMDYQAQTRQGPQAATDVFSEYQEVSGVMVPFETVTFQNGQRSRASRITDLTINASLEEGLFSGGTN